jgi:hypothetical protein
VTHFVHGSVKSALTKPQSWGCTWVLRNGYAIIENGREISPAGTDVTKRVPPKSLGHSHDDVGLNFGSNLAVAMSLHNRGFGTVGCSF